jgi:hypothetical protein
VRIGEALPDIFEKSYPVVQPSTEMLIAVSLLRFHQVDAVPIEFKISRKNHLAVFGYSCLSKLLETRTQDYGKFLKLPAIKAALKLSAVDIDNSVLELLEVFQKTKFGFAWVNSERLGGFASLRDLLKLYEKNSISTPLKLADLSSPIISLPSRASVKVVLSELFSRRIRRIFVDGTNLLVTDRRIIGHIFSPANIEKASVRPQSLLEMSLGEVEAFRPPKVSGKLSAKKGAQLLGGESDECLITEKGVVTPWDLIMKPLARDALAVKD